MLYNKHGKPIGVCAEFGCFIFISFYFSIFWGLFNETIVTLELVGYKMIIANPTLFFVGFAMLTSGTIIVYYVIGL